MVGKLFFEDTLKLEVHDMQPIINCTFVHGSKITNQMANLMGILLSSCTLISRQEDLLVSPTRFNKVGHQTELYGLRLF